MDLSRFIKVEGEKPLDRLVEDGGFTGIFRSICCIGDSLSSGEFEIVKDGEKQYHDMYEYSFGQYIARTTGAKVLNFSKGGMTAEWYWNRFNQEMDLWNEKDLCQAYIISLGINDLHGEPRPFEVGSIKDIDLQDYNKNADTFCGYYARIIQRIKSMRPDAKFFLVTMPKANPLYEQSAIEQSKLLYELAELFDNTYVIDLHEYAPSIEDADFYNNFWLNRHLNPMGYMLGAKMIMSYIDYIIRQNPKDFELVGFIGKNIL